MPKKMVDKFKREGLSHKEAEAKTMKIVNSRKGKKGGKRHGK